MKILKFILLAFLMVTPLTIFAQTEDIDVTNPSSLVALLTPILVFASVQVVKWAKPMLPGWILGLLVPGLSTLAAYLTNLWGEPDTSFIVQVLLGLSATFVHQVIKQFSTSK